MSVHSLNRTCQFYYKPKTNPCAIHNRVFNDWIIIITLSTMRRANYLVLLFDAV